MFADELPLGPSPFDYHPTPWVERNRRRGFSCARDTPDNLPCGCADCSACKKVFRDNTGPQILWHTAHRQWGALSLIDPTLRFTDADLERKTVDEFDALKKKCRTNSEPPSWPKGWPRPT